MFEVRPQVGGGECDRLHRDSSESIDYRHSRIPFDCGFHGRNAR